MYKRQGVLLLLLGCCSDASSTRRPQHSPRSLASMIESSIAASTAKGPPEKPHWTEKRRNHQRGKQPSLWLEFGAAISWLASSSFAVPVNQTGGKMIREHVTIWKKKKKKTKRKKQIFSFLFCRLVFFYPLFEKMTTRLLNIRERISTENCCVTRLEIKAHTMLMTWLWGIVFFFICFFSFDVSMYLAGPTEKSETVFGIYDLSGPKAIRLSVLACSVRFPRDGLSCVSVLTHTHSPAFLDFFFYRTTTRGQKYEKGAVDHGVWWPVDCFRAGVRARTSALSAWNRLAGVYFSYVFQFFYGRQGARVLPIAILLRKLL